MTSSLVGSEMCIRDRPMCESLLHLWKGGNSGAGAGACAGAGGVCVGMRICLLYTSDAADDM
eukprot:7566309-Prorocentrum_lima.AAC.1